MAEFAGSAGGSWYAVGSLNLELCLLGPCVSNLDYVHYMYITRDSGYWTGQLSEPIINTSWALRKVRSWLPAPPSDIVQPTDHKISLVPTSFRHINAVIRCILLKLMGKCDMALLLGVCLWPSEWLRVVGI